MNFNVKFSAILSKKKIYIYIVHPLVKITKTDDEMLTGLRLEFVNIKSSGT